LHLEFLAVKTLKKGSKCGANYGSKVLVQHFPVGLNLFGAIGKNPLPAKHKKNFPVHERKFVQNDFLLLEG
jgi:hypothetical protein